MPINANKPHLWKDDIARSVDFYNDWFMEFAPKAYQDQREQQADLVEATMSQTNDLRDITPQFLIEHPRSVQMLRMAAAPPLARDRFIGLTHVKKNLVYSMEETKKHDPRVPPRMEKEQLHGQLERVCEVLQEMIDRDICPWLQSDAEPSQREKRRAASVFADRLCGMAADPIIRNAQEREQQEAIRDWLAVRGYREVKSSTLDDVREMRPGVFTFGCTVKVLSGDGVRNLPIDCIIQPHRAIVGATPIFIEMKSAGDYTNPNKRQKEEAQKARQLRDEFGEDVDFVLFLRGYFNSQYLGYEAAENIDWVWEHRIEDLSHLELDKPDSDSSGGVVKEPVSPPSDGGGAPHISPKEQERLALQDELDAEKSKSARNKLGQFATPTVLARDIVRCAKQYMEASAVDMLDPAFGTGAFFAAARAVFGPNTIRRCQGFEIDPHYATPTRHLWDESQLTLETTDFTDAAPPKNDRGRFDLVVANPPYVRHHHVASNTKKRLQQHVLRSLGTKPSGLSGLYTYFVYLADAWVRAGGIGAWLIPSEFMYVNYGRMLRAYLTNTVSLLRVHRFDPQEVQFSDALVSSAVVIFRKTPPAEEQSALFTYGGDMNEPTRAREVPNEELNTRPKWSNLYKKPTPNPNNASTTIRVGDLFSTKRGIATGANAFFILSPDEAARRNIPDQFLKPILPSPRYLEHDVVESEDGYRPDIEKEQFLLSCTRSEDEVQDTYPSLWAYLQEGKEEGIHERYLCSRRSPWYSQELRDPAPILVSYMGRASNGTTPFRFILNRSEAIAANAYLNLYPSANLKRHLQNNPDLIRSIWKALKAITPADLIAEGRTYGGGLHKMEPSELKNAPLRIDDIPGLTHESAVQAELF